MGKGVIKKHTAAEIAAKVASHKPRFDNFSCFGLKSIRRAGGEAGKAARAPKCKYACNICKVEIDGQKSMNAHYGRNYLYG